MLNGSVKCNAAKPMLSWLIVELQHFKLNVGSLVYVFFCLEVYELFNVCYIDRRNIVIGTISLRIKSYQALYAAHVYIAGSIFKNRLVIELVI